MTAPQHILSLPGSEAQLNTVDINGETFYQISHVDALRPFFMSIVSDSNHWMFIGSNGGLTCGRKNSEYALFPYYTDDKIISSAEHTGSKSIFWVTKNDQQFLWEPFSERGEGQYKFTRNLYKNRFGNKIIFEEINHDLGLSFKYGWSSSNLYGFVRQCSLHNFSGENVTVNLLDGVQNVLPYGVGSDLQARTSNLADAYKRTELDVDSGLGIFALSAIIVDKAEPSEALKANVVWSLGLNNVKHILSSNQLNSFRKTGEIQAQHDCKGEKGAYFVNATVELQNNEQKDWMLVANVNQNHAAVVQLIHTIKQEKNLAEKVQADVKLGTENLLKLTAAADGVQYTADSLMDARHYSNVLFNIMRGGIFDNNYQIEKRDFEQYLKKANKNVFENISLKTWPEEFSVLDLRKFVAASASKDLERLATEYLPLKFSRRHGDPSRPWNQFSINTRSEIDGSKILDYQGNWRDIFQNWEALAHAYPEFMEGMIFRFLNASTFDGYNPYRITKDGFDWETIEPDNPWSYIGYWGDHQIIYLLKFYEFLENLKPGRIQQLLSEENFVYANVPYLIKPCEEILANPKDTIVFNHKADITIRQNMEQMGADGALLTNASGAIHRVSMAEKLLATTLAKLSNLVPDGGIWMNTQRPEWNDANNALVGNGLSMVTLYYLRRFLHFFQPIFANIAAQEILLSEELATLLNATHQIFKDNQHLLQGEINAAQKKSITDALGTEASKYREQIYQQHFSGNKTSVATQLIADALQLANQYLEHAIAANKRSDNLYHTYNILTVEADAMQVSHLSEMLEGQVAVLSSGYLSAAESLGLLNALRNSALYRKDQNSYILYPNKSLPGFLQKNNLDKSRIEQSALVKKMLADDNRNIVEQDINGDIHFNGNFRNANDLAAALNTLSASDFPDLENEKAKLLQLFEETFNHKEFTGRSGTFYGYEGLGSIYWHMVSKLMLAVQETCIRAINENADANVVAALKAHYFQIRDGIGVHKSPEVYGAFPIDPYSHTPMHKGAQQPGMTGQVKEDILCRIGELGVLVEDGKISFKPMLLQSKEFTTAATQVSYVDVNGEEQNIQLPANAMLFTYCQVPVMYVRSNEASIELEYQDGRIEKQQSHSLTEQQSASIFNRCGQLRFIKVLLNAL